MGKIAKYAIIGTALWIYGKANRAIGYALGTIDTLGSADIKTYEKSFGDMKLKLTKIEKEA